MATKERYQNPTTTDTLNLRLFTYNSNNLQDVQSVSKVEIYFLDPTEVSETNRDGRRLVDTINVITQEDTGKYLITISMFQPKYTIGKYLDVWYLNFEGEESPATVSNPFEVYPDLWYTTPIPIVYDFAFTFRPNRLRKGAKQYLIIEITPNVPRGTDLARYYENLAIVSNLKISIEQKCGDCVPAEDDLRLIVDAAPVDYREKRFAYFLFDTSDYDCGIYNVWFELDFGESIYLSNKNQLQIF